MILPGWIIGGAIPSITRTDGTFYNGALANPINFSSRSLGAEGRRHIGVAVGHAGGNTISSVTVAGVSATLIASAASGNAKSALFIVSLPTGTTGDVVVTMSGSSSDVSICVYAIYNIRSATPFDTATNTQSVGNTVTTLSLDANVPARGVVFSSVQGVSWTFDANEVGLSNVATNRTGSIGNRSADYTATTAETPRTMGWSADRLSAGCLATFR